MVNQEADPERISCEYCDERISYRAQVCPHCHSQLSKREKRWTSASRCVTAVASLATAVAIYFLLWSNLQTRQAIDMQRDALVRTDSTLALVNEQIALMREANDLQREVNSLNQMGQQEEVRAFVEEHKPKLDIISVKAKPENDSLTVYTDINNLGKSTAYDVTIQMIAKDSGASVIGLSFDSEHDYISAGRTKVEPWRIPARPNVIVCKITAHWTWPQYNIVDSIQKFFGIRCDTLQNTCSCKYLSNNQIPFFWSEE